MSTKRPALPAYKERIWLNLQSNLLDFNKGLIEAIEQEAWTPAYETFTEAYTDKLGNITFARELLPHIMYAMFNEGATPEEVAAAVKGVGDERAEDLKHQYDQGVPADKASMSVVRRHLRSKPSEPSFIHVEVGPDNFKRFAATAKMLNKTVETIAAEAIVDRFVELEKHSRRESA